MQDHKDKEKHPHYLSMNAHEFNYWAAMQTLLVCKGLDTCVSNKIFNGLVTEFREKFVQANATSVPKTGAFASFVLSQEVVLTMLGEVSQACSPKKEVALESEASPLWTNAKRYWAISPGETKLRLLQDTRFFADCSQQEAAFKDSLLSLMKFARKKVIAIEAGELQKLPEQSFAGFITYATREIMKQEVAIKCSAVVSEFYRSKFCKMPSAQGYDVTALDPECQEQDLAQWTLYVAHKSEKPALIFDDIAGHLLEKLLQFIVEDEAHRSCDQLFRGPSEETVTAAVVGPLIKSSYYTVLKGWMGKLLKSAACYTINAELLRVAVDMERLSPDELAELKREFKEKPERLQRAKDAWEASLKKKKPEQQPKKPEQQPTAKHQMNSWMPAGIARPPSFLQESTK